MPQIFAFLIIFVVVFLIVSIGGRILSKVVHFTPLGIIDRILGGVLGLIKGLVICFVLLIVVMLIRKDTRVLTESQIAKQVAASGIEASKLLPRAWFEWVEETFKRSDFVRWNENDHVYF
jgi:membrane protein required for colicin V production